VNKTMKLIIGAAAMVVAAAVLTGAFFILERAPAAGSSENHLRDTLGSHQDGPAPIQIRQGALVNPRKRPPRVMESIDRDRARRSLAVPIPTTRDEFNENRRQEKAAAEAEPRQRKDADPMTVRHGPRPVEATIESAARLQAKGRTDDAERMLRNAILTEPNPLNRGRLEKELEQIRRGSGRKQPTGSQPFKKQ